MGKRRMTCGSGNPAEYQEESSNGRRHTEGDRRRNFLLCALLGLGIALVVVPQWSSAEETEGNCNHICWQKTISQDLNFNDGILLQEIGSEKLCKDICANNETCAGAYWGFDPTSRALNCWHKTTTGGGAGSLTGANYSVAANCTDECLPYCWKPKTEGVKTLGGVIHRSVKSEVQCKLMCTNDHMCDGVDWNINSSVCYLLYKHRRTKDPVNHWEIVRNLPTNCSKNEEQCLPHCWNKTEFPGISFSDGLLKTEIKSEKDCKEICGSNQTCTGVYWGFSTSANAETCFLKIPSGGATDTLSKATQWVLSNCTDDCFDYCWLQKWNHIQTAGGSLRRGISEEIQCKMTCAVDKRCKGLDFNTTARSCWLLHELNFIVTKTPHSMHHWENERNLPMVCSNEPSVVSTMGPNIENATSQNATSVENVPAPAENKTEGKKGPLETGKSISEAGGGNASKCGAETGEAALGQALALPPAECPTYMTGIITLAALMAVCVLIIIGLVAYIVSRSRPISAKNAQLLTGSRAAFRSYQSILSDTSEAEVTTK